MSVDQVQDVVSSREFTEWAAFYGIEAESSGLIQREPTPEELGDKLSAWAAMHNAGTRGKERR